jgi:hypothetical protein
VFYLFSQGRKFKNCSIPVLQMKMISTCPYYLLLLPFVMNTPMMNGRSLQFIIFFVQDQHNIKNFSRKIIYFCCLARYHCIRPCSVWKWKHQKSFAGSGGKPKSSSCKIILTFSYCSIFHIFYLHGVFCSWLAFSGE